MVIIYFSGTGNTRYVAYRVYDKVLSDNKAIYSIEDDVDFDEVIQKARTVIFLYPIIGGDMPYIVRVYLRRYRSAFYGKELITIVTEAGFSGDGGALAYRYLDTDRVTYKASKHIFMPANVSFGPIKVRIDNSRKVKRADRQIDKFIDDINKGVGRRQGSSKLSYCLGYYLQRKYFSKMEPRLRNKFDVDYDRCISCGKCIKCCPMHNVTISDGKVVGLGKCTLCYRCLHICPKNAITLLTHEKVQYRGVNNGEG